MLLQARTGELPGVAKTTGYAHSASRDELVATHRYQSIGALGMAWGDQITARTSNEADSTARRTC